MINKSSSPGGIADNDRRLDRLIDGELTPAEYRTFVASLDDEPGAWRRCALAFLESQALSGELGQIRRTFDLGEPLASPPLTTHHSPLTSPRSLLAIAASFLVAFALGILAPRFFAGSPQELQPAGNHIASAEPSTGEVRRQAIRPIGNLRLVTDGPGGESLQSDEVPVYDSPDDMDEIFRQQQPALAPELVELLRQRGHTIEQQRQYIPYDLEDGRQVVVPIDGYQITPVSRPAY